MTPTTLRPKEFEALLLKGAARTPGVTMGRYGVMANLVDNQWRPVPSLPDFEGVIAGGCQFILEAKVCSKSALQLDLKILKAKQVSHMLARSSFGVPCFLVVHFCERKLKKTHEPAETIAVPVHSRIPFWQEFVDEAKAAKAEKRPFRSPGSLNRDLASRLGQRIEWTAPGRSRTPLPDLGALLGICSPPVISGDLFDHPSPSSDQAE